MRSRMLFLLAFLLLCMTATALAQPSEQVIFIDVERMSLTLYEDGVEVFRRPIAAGARDTPTPLGIFRITGRFRTEQVSGFGTCFLKLNVPWGQYGIHGTNRPGSIGSHASHGCIRMYIADAETLYARVKNGTRVVIQNGAYGELGTHLEPITYGDRGNHVRAVQQKLHAMGYFSGSCDGVWGAATEHAVKEFKADHGLAEEPGVNAAVYAALGILLFE